MMERSKTFKKSLGVTTRNQKAFLTLLIIVGCAWTQPAAGQISVSGSNGQDGSYSSLTKSGGAFAALNGGNQAGKNITISITGDVTTEDGANALTGSSGMWTTLLIQPSGGASRTISGSVANPLIDLNGATYVTIDGLNSSSNALTIENTNTGSSGVCTIRFINGAANNTVQNATIKGASTSLTLGTILFSTTSATLGNNSNLISACNIAPSSSNMPYNAIYAAGTTAKQNTSNTIQNCSVYDFFNSAGNCNGILVAAYNITWTISGNSFYQTASRSTSGTMSAISLSVSTVYGFTITGNYIGGQQANCGGSAFTLTGSSVFNGIRVTAGTTSATSVQGNTIQNISITSDNVSALQAAIYMTAGAVNCGTSTGNTIGNQSTTGDISVSLSGSGAVFSGIKATGGTINISNNTIGGISFSTSGSPATIPILYGINATVSCTISANTIGSTTTSNSISGSANSILVCINYNATNGATISGNTIANVSQTGTSTGNQLVGILLPSNGLGSSSTITGNTIRNLTSASSVSGTGSSAAMIGISCTSAGGPQSFSISQNIIHSLQCTDNSATVSIVGLYSFQTSGGGPVERNLVHSLALSTSSTSATLTGIYVGGGYANYQNNMVRLGINPGGSDITTEYQITGIYDGIASSTNKYYYNSVYIGGSGVGSTANNTYAFYSIATGGSSRKIVDNIFMNARSNSSSGGKHYAIKLSSTAGTGFTIDYNDYYVSGTGGTFGAIGSTDYADLTAWKGGTAQDANSKSFSPNFANPNGGSSAVDLHLNVSGVNNNYNGTPISGTTNDYDNDTRGTIPYIGADEVPTYPLPVQLVSFTAALLNTTVRLSWVTATEINNYGFTIERRRLQNGSWEEIGFVEGHGTVNTPQRYSFVDARPLLANEMYYRLRQTDRDETVQYSQEIAVSLAKAAGFELIRNYPNPFNPATIISYSMPVESDVEIKVLSMLGEDVATLVNEHQLSGVHTVTFNAAGLPSGIYVCRLRAGNSIHAKTMVISK
jgi:hypothetical protein